MARLFSCLIIRPIIFLGGFDGGYRSALESLRTDGYGEKIALIDHGGDNAWAISDLNLPIFSVPNLFFDKASNSRDMPGQTIPTPPTSPANREAVARPLTPSKIDGKSSLSYSSKIGSSPKTPTAPAPRKMSVVMPVVDSPRPKINPKLVSSPIPSHQL